MYGYVRPLTPDEIYHHGVKNQKWGVRNGPPYPLDKQKKFTSNKKSAKIAGDDFYKRSSSLKEIKLSPKEYGHVMHELATNITKEQKQHKIIHKAIGDYRYTFENRNGVIRVIGKKKID
ncbi:MAG: hypothetical protein E7571_05400 [Ruminococcaceae bacterium]|nr:hypothetical protein [Oscillospiraceae bacterium]